MSLTVRNVRINLKNCVRAIRKRLLALNVASKETNRLFRPLRSPVVPRYPAPAAVVVAPEDTVRLVISAEQDIVRKREAPLSIDSGAFSVDT